GAAAGVGSLESLGHHRVAGDDVVAVHPDRRDAEAGAAVHQRDAALLGGGPRDRPLVVLAEEDHGGGRRGGEHHRLADVALRGGAVAEVGDGGAVAVGVAGADVAVALDTHGVAGGVQRVRADDQGGHVVVVLAGVPAAVLAAAVEQQQAAYVEAAHP